MEVRWVGIGTSSILMYLLENMGWVDMAPHVHPNNPPGEQQMDGSQVGMGPHLHLGVLVENTAWMDTVLHVHHSTPSREHGWTRDG